MLESEITLPDGRVLLEIPQLADKIVGPLRRAT